MEAPIEQTTQPSAPRTPRRNRQHISQAQDPIDLDGSSQPLSGQAPRRGHGGSRGGAARAPEQGAGAPGSAGERTRNPRRRNGPRADNSGGPADSRPSTDAESAPPARSRRPKVRAPQNGARDASGGPPDSRTATDANAAERAPYSQNRRGKARTVQHAGTEESGRRPGRRGAKFNAELTTGDGQPTSAAPHSAKSVPAAPVLDDLTSILIHSLRTPPYPDCPICFSAVRVDQATWSCSPSTPVVIAGGAAPQYCWTTFHIKCIRAWAAKSVKDVADAWRARGETRAGDWRCPGCQVKREIVPSGYWCFCGSTPEPKPPRLATPHSCANACSRPRSCGHACPIACHPGPCPPCQVTTELPCYCGSHTLAFRCARLQTLSRGGGSELSCGNVCGKKLACGNHNCTEVCHEGECAPCAVKDQVRCYCGKEEKEVACGEGVAKEAFLDAANGKPSEHWVGRYQCGNPCNREFACGIHRCSKPCHPPSPSPPICPQDPSIVTHCPCGKHTISPDSADHFSPKDAGLLQRIKCTDPIPTCTSTCMKPLHSCSHVCSAPCHAGACPPCTISLVRPCRCGATTRAVRCADAQAGAADAILCDRPCAALRACGRHQCNRVCCPLAALGGARKGKKRTALLEDAGGAEHECDLVCGKMLACGNHRCEARDHRGACAPCFQSTFEEVACHCGRTVLEPPIACGTRIQCSYPCARPPPPCGHPRTPHACHEDPASCPPCPFLASKTCACGKKAVGNVRCSQEKVSCGIACGKLLACGFHHCERLCHGDDCGPCTTTCGKPRKLCLPDHHPCLNACHAPSACDESEPCAAPIVLTCPCGRIRQTASCARSTSSPRGRATPAAQPKCSAECALAKRNARLADALGISAERTGERAVVWNEEVLAFARANAKFAALVEATFAEFVNTEKKAQVLPHMPPERRKFVHDVAAVYRMDTQMVDQEPHRSVRLLRRIDTRIPTPLLSAATAASSSLGKLANLRAPAPRQAPARALGVIMPAKTSAPATRAWAAAHAVSPAGSGATTPTARPVTPGARAAVDETPTVDAEEVPENWEDDS